jgi:ribosomal protein L7/L12
VSDDKELPAVTVARLAREGMSQDDILTQLRASGHSTIESIKALHDGEGISLTAAKQAVHFSRAWADQREANETFHETIEKILTDDGSEIQTETLPS